MGFFSELAQHVAVLSGLCGEDITADQLPQAVARLSGDDAVAVIAQASAVVRAAEKLRIAASGVVAAGSTREHGHSGVAQTHGHRSPVSLVQELMGSTKADAVKHVRLGESLLATVAPAEPQVDDSAEPAGPAAEPWHAPLSRALLTGTISSTQHDTILRGLGEPPAGDDDERTAAVAWSLAAEQLIAEAAERTVEELARAARTVRDLLDPEGATRRFDERFERRSWRMWTDQDGAMRGSIAFDDFMGAWVRTILDAALRPRRGGPRFVDPDEQERAQELMDDRRTNDQLAYDLLMDTLRAGVLADAETVFGTRQVGVRVVITEDAMAAAATAAAAHPGIALAEDDQTALPAWLVAQAVCDSGTLKVTVDRDGNPLYLGREQRLFSPKQRIALAIRDGGCRWRGCDRQASYCEAHHVDEYAEGGCTDVDRGLLLCRFHHMQLHHGGWRITRDDLGDFVLHPPGGGEAIVLKPRLALTYAWAGIDPPPKRFRPAA